MSTIDPSVLTASEKKAYLKALESAIFRGVDYVSYGGDQVKYVSLEKMLMLREMLRYELGMPSTRRRHPRSRRIIVKGFR